MSRGDENLDKMFQDAFSGQGHQMDPMFWEGMKPMLQAPKVAWYLSKTFLAISTVAVLSTSVYLISDSTPENQISADLVPNKTILLNTQTNSSTTKTELNIPKNITDFKTNTSSNQKSTITNKGQETRESQFSSNASPIEKSLGSTTTVASEVKEARNTSNSINPISSSVSANQKSENAKEVIASNEAYNSTNSEIRNSDSPSHKNQKERLATKTVIPASSVSIMAPSNNIAPNKNEVKNTASNETGKSNGTYNSNNSEIDHTDNPSNKENLNKEFATKTVLPTSSVSMARTSNNIVPNKNEERNTASEEVLNPKPQNTVATTNQVSSLEDYYNNAIAQNGNATHVGLMATNSDFVFPFYNEFSPPPPSENDGNLKSLNKPFSVRLSVGYLWSKAITDSQNNIRNYANSKNVELNLEYHFKPRWGIQIGASFNQITEDQSRSYPKVEDQSYYDYTDKEITLNDSTWWLGGWFYYPPYQDTITDTAYISKFDTGQVDLKTSQRIKVIEIPVLLTYNFSVQQFTAQIATGASIGIFANTSGNYLEYGDPITVKPSSRNLFNSLQYNYLLRSELGYSLNDHWQITASPQMKINLNSLYKNESGFTNKYLFYGINAGLAYHF